MDFKGIRIYIINFLSSELDTELTYHSLAHTLNVELAVEKYAKQEGVSKSKILLLKTAALFHDCGYIYQYSKNEPFSVQHFKSVADQYGYSEIDMSFIERIIMATSRSYEPTDVFEKIICDSDHDYLGSKNYHHIAELLRKELKVFGETMTEIEWLNKQIDYLQNEHHYYTESAIKTREKGKILNIETLKSTLKSLDFEK